MPVNDSAQHVVRTSAQWDERAIEFWVVPRGCLCVELTPDGKTKIKIGEGNKFYSQLPYITSEGDLANYYTKTEIDNLLTNLNRMAIQSTEEYDSKNDLPLTGNKLGDVRFVKSASPSIKTDPDVYVWNNTKWIYVGYDFSQIDLSEYVKKEEFEPVKEKVDEMYPLRHTHTNKEILDQVEVAFKVVDKNKLDSLENYDDTEVKNRLTNVENKAHVHNNMQILNMTTAAFTIPDKNKLDSLRNYDVFRGTNGIIPGTIGLVPAPQPGDFSKVLGANGNWVDVDVAPFTGATATTDGEEGLVPAPLAGEQSYYLRGDGTWAKVKSGDKYRAGDGIYILAGDVLSTTLPVEIYAKDNKLKQYVLYGGENPVGDWDSTLNKYAVVIKVSVEGMNDISTSLFLDDPIGNGDYIDYENQRFVHTRTNMTFSEGRAGHWIDVNGEVPNWSQDSMCTSEYIAVSSEYVYLYYPGDMHGCDQFGIPCYAALYDENKVFTRSILLRSFTEVTIEPQPGEVYMRVSFGYYQGSWYRLTQMGEVITPIILPPVIIYTNKVNAIDVMTTNKPTEVYFETAVVEDTSEDPMSEYTGIIYNDGVLDITQEDPNALNELTVHFRDDSKVLTLPDAEPMTGATASTDGTGGTVPAPLMGEEGMFLRGDGTWANVPGSGEAEQYGAGAGINIIKGEASGDKFPINIASNDNYLEEYIIYGTEAGVGDYDSTTHKYVIPVVVTAKDEDPIRSYIYLDDPLGQGEYVIYSDQKAVKYRENVLLSAGYESGQFLADGHRYTGDVDQYLQPIAFVTHKITMVYGDRYTLSGLTFDEHESSTKNFQHWHSFNDLSIVEITPYSESPISVPQPCGPVNRDDIEITVLGYEDNLYKARFYHHFDTATDVSTTLAQITIYAGKINTLDVETTNKPDQIYVRAHINTDPDAPPIPETWIIENTGILDVEQDETDRNKLTFKYKDTDKVITIPGGGGSGSYTSGQGIDITNDEISAKLGSGLSFDQNDAIQANQMTGADGTNAGVAGIVPAPNATDNTKFLKGDGTWDSLPSYTLPIASSNTLGGIKVGNGLSIDQNGVLSTTNGIQYQAGQGVEIETVPELVDQYFDYTEYISTVQGVEHGSITKNNDDSFTITSTADDAYTYPYNSGHGTLYTMAVDPNTTYRLTFDLSDWSVDSYVNVFKNGSTNGWRADMPSDGYLEFITGSDAATIAFRFGVTYRGHTQTFSNIKLYQVSESTTVKSISAKLGEGLSFDSNDAIEVDSMIGATSQTAGVGGTVPAPSAGDENKFLKGDGTWDSPPSYTLPVATTSTLGGVKVGAGLSMNANDELGVTSPYVTSVTNQGSVPGVITVTKSDGISSDVDVLESLRLILNCNYDSSVTRSQLGEPVNAPQSGRTMGSPIMGDLTIIEVNE